ncbi:MAG: hypothetical protein Q9220_001334 [cf. Caloplaca sp. 1 TL-2023]
MQHIYLWEGSKDGAAKKRDRGAGFTNKPYKADEDGPAVVEQGGRLPTGDELQPGSNAVQYLEVGLVVGDKPDMYKPTKATSKKTAQNERINLIKGHIGCRAPAIVPKIKKEHVQTPISENDVMELDDVRKSTQRVFLDLEVIARVV